MMPRKPYLIVMTIAVASLLASCGSMRNTATVNKTVPATSSGRDKQTMEIPANIHPHSHALLEEAKRWLGTPYKYGGEDKNGIDCSALVLNIYRSALDIKLPRSSREQANFCSPLDKGKLMPGDLLFFSTSGSRDKVSHVGIYIGDNRMIHSSTSKGVIISDIDAAYYQRTFACAGYVEKYHAMIDGKMQPTEAPFTLTPLDVLPVKSELNTAATASNPPSASPSTVKASAAPKPAAKTAVKPVTQKNSSNPATEPTPDEARRAVLNSLIEQKIDSIFNK